MELKLTVSIGATLQVRNAKGEWDWIKPEVGAEVSLWENEVASANHQAIFSEMWDSVVGPQFKNVVNDLLAEPLPEGAAESESISAEGTPPDEISDEMINKNTISDADETPDNVADEDYY